jgi:hypothetical protein
MVFSDRSAYIDFCFGARAESLREAARLLPVAHPAVHTQAELDALTRLGGPLELCGGAFTLRSKRRRKKPVVLALTGGASLELHSVPAEVIVEDGATLTGEVTDLKAWARKGRIEVGAALASDLHVLLYGDDGSVVVATDARVMLSHRSRGKVYGDSVVHLFERCAVEINDGSLVEVLDRGHVTVGASTTAQRARGQTLAATFYGPGRLTLTAASGPLALVLYHDDVQVVAPTLPTEWWQETWALTEAFVAKHPPRFPDEERLRRLREIRLQLDEPYRHVEASASFKALPYRKPPGREPLGA